MEPAVSQVEEVFYGDAVVAGVVRAIFPWEAGVGCAVFAEAPDVGLAIGGFIGEVPGCFGECC